MPEPRPCPVCDSKGERRILHRQRFYEGVLGDGYDVVVCASCGAGFADGILEQEALDRYYAEQSKYTYSASGGAESEYDFRRFEGIVDQLEPAIPKSARILDIGCATGGLLAAFKRRGFLNVLGVDPAPLCSVAAQRLYNIEVLSATIPMLSGWTDRFDLVLMVGVLEHLRQAKAAVSIVSNLLNYRGLYYVAVPDVEGLASARNAPFQQFSMEHVNFFSLQSLTRLVAACGLACKLNWQYQLDWRERVTEPIVAGLYELGEVSPSVLVDAVTRSSLESYVTLSKLADTKISQLMNDLVEKKEPIFVWGTGALTRRLLSTTRLSEVNIIAFVDSSIHSKGSTLAERTIILPDELAGRREPILICSVAFQYEIVEMIRTRLMLDNKLYTLAGLGILS